MRTIEEAVNESVATIAYILERPTMYVGSVSAPNSAEALEAVLHLAHSFWAMLTCNSTKFRSVCEDVRKLHDCGPYTFPHPFRRMNSDASEEEVCNFVVSCWREIDDTLGIDLKKGFEDALKPPLPD